MSNENIKSLIESFYRGETDLEQEQQLYDYFAGNDVAPELLHEKSFFEALANHTSIDVPVGLNAKLETLVDRLAQREALKLRGEKRRFVLWAGGIAASITLLFFIGQLYFTTDNLPMLGDAKTDTYTDPNLAYIEVQRALTMVSSNFNKGLSHISLVSTNMDKSSRILNKSLNMTQTHDYKWSSNKNFQ